MMEDLTTPSSCESSENAITREEEEDMMVPPSLASGGGPFRGSPPPHHYGIKMSPSLRRGAAAYAQLLESAVRASMETSTECANTSTSTAATNYDYYFDLPDSSPNHSTKDVTTKHHCYEETQQNEQQQQQRAKRERDDMFPPARLRRNHSRTEDLFQGILVSHHSPESLHYGDENGDSDRGAKTSSMDLT